MYHPTDNHHTLKIKIMETCPNYEYVKEYYEKRAGKIGFPGDCGVDLIFPSDQTIPVNKVTKIGLGIQCEFGIHKDHKWEGGGCHAYYGEPFMLVPRSSISSTPLMMANSVGIIDAGYRGEIITAVRCHTDVDHVSTINDVNFAVKQGDRLFQIIAYDGKPIKVELVTELTGSERGSCGFGSTNTKK